MKKLAGAATVPRWSIACFRRGASAEDYSRTPLRRFWYVARFLVLLVPLVLIIGLLWVIWTRTADVPYWDEWETVLLVQRLHQDTLGLSNIVAFHNVHRIIIPRLVDLTLIELTHWNRQVEMTFDLSIAIAGAGILFWCVRRTLGSLTAALGLVLPLSLLFFSFSQFGDWFAPFQVQFIVTSFGVVCCVRGFFTTPVSRKGFALAISGALIGSMSGLHGLLTWIAFLPGALHSGVRKTTVWISCGVVVWILYFQNFPQGPTGIPVLLDIVYSLAYLGAPVGYPNSELAAAVGFLSILLLLGNMLFYWRRHKSLWHIAPWLQLALFVLGCTQATAEGRSFSGPLQALSSRYEAFSALWWIALLVIIGLNVKEFIQDRDLSRRRGYIARAGTLGINLAALLLITTALVPVNLVGLQQALLWQDVQQQNQGYIVDYQNAPDSCLELYYPWPALLRPRVQFLSQQRLGIFSSHNLSRRVVISPTANCRKPYHFIDDVGGGGWNVIPLETGLVQAERNAARTVP